MNEALGSFQRSSSAMNEEVVIQIRNALLWDLIVPHDRVEVGYESGWVTLKGVVRHAYQKSAAEADVS